MHSFALSRADDPAKAIAAHVNDPQLAFIAGGTGPPRPDEGPRDASRAPAGHQRTTRYGADGSVAGRRPAHWRAGSDERRGGEHRRAPALSCHRRKRCCSPHPASCVTWRRSAATSCSGRAAPISATTMAPRATSGDPAPAARPVTASIAITRSSDGPTPALPPILLTSRWHWRPSTQTSLCSGWRESVSIPFADFHRLPGSTPERDNTLDRGELIVAIDVPARVEGRASHYLKVRDRESYEFALVSAAAAVATDRRRLRSVRLAMGGIAHKPWRLAAAETALRGVSLDDIDALQVGDRLNPSSMLGRSTKTVLRLSLPSASHCVRCKPRENAHERGRTTDFTRRWTAEGDRPRALHGRYPARGRRTRCHRP